MENKLIIGPAGCLKTTRLAEIYAQLLNDGEKIDDIAAVSFNRSVANKIAEKVGENKGRWKEELRISYTVLSRVKRELYLDGNSPFTPIFLSRR